MILHKNTVSFLGNCPDITSFRNGEVSIEGLSVGHSATFSCNENYTYCGENSIVCKYDLKWHRPSPLCKSNVFVKLFPSYCICFCRNSY